MPQPLQVSLSAYQTWQRCQQKYKYKYVDRLSPLVKAPAPERGSIAHEYMETYYLALKAGKAPDAAHGAGLAKVMTYGDKLAVAAATAFYAGREDDAAEYQRMLPELIDLLERYFIVRGKRDAEQYVILSAEERLNVMIVTGIISQSVIDLVVRDKDTGVLSMFEHKTTKSVPDSRVRIRDLQTLLYTEVLKHKGLEISSIVWNYLRTKTPDTPHQNKDGKFSKAIGIDTTWERYAKAVSDAEQDPDDEYYAPVKERLANAEETVWFPRYEHVIVADPGLLLRDYAHTAREIRQTRLLWEMGVQEATRAIDRSCDFCEFYKLCEAAITGGDEEDIIRLRFKRPEGEKK